MNIISTTIQINKNNLPEGLWWEEDKSCWKAVACNPEELGCDWRWQPMNWKAFEKFKPESKMINYYPFYAKAEPPQHKEAE